jgi:hypothetical protein
MWNISAEPIPSRISTPKRRRNSVRSCGGSALPCRDDEAQVREGVPHLGFVEPQDPRAAWSAPRRGARRPEAARVRDDHLRLARLGEERHRQRAGREREHQVHPGRVPEEELAHGHRHVALATRSTSPA